jgi:hypothetical protein
VTEHTPGPWNAIPRVDLAENGNVIVESSCEVICHVYNDNNASLIAAAPNLLAALEAALDEIAELKAERECLILDYQKEYARANKAEARYRGLRDGFLRIKENYLHTEEELTIGHIPLWRHRLKDEPRWPSLDAAIDAAIDAALKEKP